MEISIFRFTAKQLQSVHADHLGFIIASSHCCNELTCVLPYIMFEQDIEKANEAESALINIRFFTVVRFQISKIFEYRELCNNYVGKIRRTFPALASRLQDESGKISRSINRARWAETVRNKASFHFDESYAMDVFKRLPPETSLALLAGNLRGLTAYDFADKAIVQAMFVEAGSGDEGAGKDVVLRWAIDLQKQITTFHAEIIKHIFQQLDIFQKEEKASIRDEWCATPGTLGIPLSTLKVT